jgi:glycosyltransferase involved in cell wall biosynthesis
LKIELLVSHYERMIGLARYTASLQKYLEQAGAEYRLVGPSYPLPVRAAHGLLRPLGYNVKEFFNTYPISATFSRDSIKHFTTQMMASLLSFQPGLKPVIITVHDIIPYMMRDDPQQSVYQHFYDRQVDSLAMHNLRRADYLIADSEYTQRMLVEKLGCMADKIQVGLLGIDHDTFKPQPVTDSFRARYQLEPACRHLLYVGSENPRKNLSSLIRALPMIQAEIPNVRLLKVGTPEYIENYRRLQKEIHALNLEDTVIFIDHVPQEDLATLYSAVDVFVFPSLYEGFGMPPLEAMACGAPVICSNAASLLEVVGDAALTLAPLDVEGWADAICEILSNNTLRQDLQARGLRRASQFTWERTALETMAVYEKVSQAL